MRWDELRGLGTANAVWALRGERTKNGQPHLVPLVPSVQTVVMSVPRTSSLVFSTNDTTAVSGFSKAKSLLDARVARLRSAEGLPPVKSWTLHDVRRSMVTIMNERLAVPPHVVEAVVNHTSGAAKRGVAGIYNRALYFDERRIALQAWDSYLRSLIEVEHAPWA